VALIQAHRLALGLSSNADCGTHSGFRLVSHLDSSNGICDLAAGGHFTSRDPRHSRRSRRHAGTPANAQVLSGCSIVFGIRTATASPVIVTVPCAATEN